MRSASYTAVIRSSDQGWIGWVEEVPGVNCQEPTRDELLESLRVCLREAIKYIGGSYEEVLFDA